MEKISPKPVLLAIAAFCFCLLIYAWYLQHGPDRQQPCPLCVLQRMAYIFIGVAALVGAFVKPLTFISAAQFGAIAGMGMAAWQISKGASLTGCLQDPVGIFVNGLPTANYIPQYFFANGSCADAYSALGLPVPVWSLICFLVIESACLLLIIQEFRRRKVNTPV